METSERLVLFRPIPIIFAFNDVLGIIKKSNLNIAELDPEKGVIRAEFVEHAPAEECQIVAKFWKWRERILIGLRGSVSVNFSSVDKLERTLEKLQRDLRQLHYAY